MKLYKYVSADRIDVVERLRIRYTQPGAFNDPFEMKPYVRALAEEDELRTSLDSRFDQVVENAWRELPDNARAMVPLEQLRRIAAQPRSSIIELSAILGNIVARKLGGRLVSKFDERLGVLSLTEKPDNLIMWAHYASSHEGLVVGFEADHDHFSQKRGPHDELRHLRKVQYRNQRPNRTLQDLDGVEVLLVKSKQWEYEEEWRILRAFEDAAELITSTPYPIYLFEIPPSCIQEIILGCRASKVTRERVSAIVKNSLHLSHVQIFEAIPDDKEHRLYISKV